jgi:hypothetical protein
MFQEFLRRGDLRGMLVAPGRRVPFPTAADRSAWEALPARETLLRWGDEAKRGYPPLTAAQYLAFARTGDRKAFEKPYFQRRTRLIGATLAECAAGDGSYLDAVIDGVWCLCEETSWVISAHNGAADGEPGHERLEPLPDARKPYVDLFSAQTAATLAYTVYLLGPALDGVTPLIRRRVREELENRVFIPFLTRDDFWWMGYERKNLNNWTPWILSNVIDAFLLTEEEDGRLTSALTRAMEMLDRYLACQPEDGGLDEGCGYWNMAGASLLDCLESLRLATGGEADFYAEPLVRNIAAFPLKAHVGGEWYWNFADCDAKPLLDGERMYTFGLRTRNPSLAALGYTVAKSASSPVPRDTPQMNRVLHALFTPLAPVRGAGKPADGAALPSLQVFAFRRGAFYAALKGGHNDESHNHNDVGSVVVYYRGEPCAVDAGNLIYTKKTFSAKRYTLWNTRAAFHNLPIVGGVEQREGARYRASDVRTGPDGASMQLCGAYPAGAGLLSFRRELAVRDTAVTVTDELTLSEPRPVTWVWMVRQKPVPATAEPGMCALTIGGVRLEADAPLRFTAREIRVTDARMARCFPGSLWRVTLEAAPAKDFHVRFGFLGDERHG